MEAQTKRKQVRVYLDSKAEHNLKQVTKGVHSLSESAIVTELVYAALDACVKAGDRLPIPLKFRIVERGDSDYQLNDENPTKARR